MKPKDVINWKASTTYVDADTGEIIPTKKKFETEYYKISTKTEYSFNKTKTHGQIKHTTIGRRKPIQTRLL